MSIEIYPLSKKSVENKHGKIHPWTHKHKTDTDMNREKDTTVRDRDTNG
jgi:hypothetical protein